MNNEMKKERPREGGSPGRTPKDDCFMGCGFVYVPRIL